MMHVYMNLCFRDIFNRDTLLLTASVNWSSLAVDSSSSVSIHGSGRWGLASNWCLNTTGVCLHSLSIAVQGITMLNQKCIWKLYLESYSVMYVTSTNRFSNSEIIIIMTN